MNKTFITLLIVVFAAISGIAYGLSRYNAGFNFMVLMIANGIMFVTTLLAYIVAARSLNGRPQVFVRGVFSGTIIKLFTCMAAILIYAVSNKGHIYKPIMFAFFGIYILYTIVETWTSSRIAKKNT